MSVVVVTGSNDGIGYEMVKILASHGHQVWLCSRDLEKGQKAVETLGNKDNIHLVQLAVNDLASIAKAVATITAKSGKVDTLINNAGLFAFKIGFWCNVA